MFRKMYLMPPSRPIRISSATGGGERRRQTGRDEKTQLPAPLARALTRQRHTCGTRGRPARRRKRKRQHPYARWIALRKRQQLTVPASRRQIARKRRGIALRKESRGEREFIRMNVGSSYVKSASWATLNRPPLEHSRRRRDRRFWSI
jgi:hypothetical protein